MKAFLKKLFTQNKNKIGDYAIFERFFDGRRIDYISNIICSQDSPEWLTYSFEVYFNSGFVIKITQDVSIHENLFNCPELIKTRELFINNLGFSCFRLKREYLNTDKRKEIQIYYKSIYNGY